MKKALIIGGMGILSGVVSVTLELNVIGACLMGILFGIGAFRITRIFG